MLYCAMIKSTHFNYNMYNNINNILFVNYISNKKPSAMRIRHGQGLYRYPNTRNFKFRSALFELDSVRSFLNKFVCAI